MYAVSNGYSNSYYAYTPVYQPVFYSNMRMQNPWLYLDADGARRNFDGNNRVVRRQISGSFTDEYFIDKGIYSIVRVDHRPFSTKTSFPYPIINLHKFFNFSTLLFYANHNMKMNL